MTFNVAKMERPHRSGVISVCAMYALMYAVLDFTSFGCHGRDATWVDVAVCHLFPPLCFCLKHEHQHVEAREYNVTKLYYCPDCKVKEHKEEKCIPFAEFEVPPGTTINFLEVYEVKEHDLKFQSFACPTLTAAVALSARFPRNMVRTYPVYFVP